MIGPVPLISALYKIKDSYNLDMLAQKIALAALNDVDHMHNNVAKISYAGTTSPLSSVIVAGGTDSQSNCLCQTTTGMAAADIFTALRQRHIFVRYFPRPDTADYLRLLSVRTSDNHPACSPADINASGKAPPNRHCGLQLLHREPQARFKIADSSCCTVLAFLRNSNFKFAFPPLCFHRTQFCEHADHL